MDKYNSEKLKIANTIMKNKSCKGIFCSQCPSSIQYGIFTNTCSLTTFLSRAEKYIKECKIRNVK